RSRHSGNDVHYLSVSRVCKENPWLDRPQGCRCCYPHRRFLRGFHGDGSRVPRSRSSLASIRHRTCIMIENDKHDRACESTGLLGLRGLKLAVRCGYSITTLSLLLLLICGTTVDGAEALHPLAPPDTSSPRGTLNTFLNEMNKAVDAYKAGPGHHARA